MIDTLKIYSQEYSLKTDNLFEVQTIQLLSTGAKQAEKIFCNKVPGVNLSISYDNKLFIQTSFPKLIYKTSLFEIQESDCERALELLTQKCSLAGVSLSDNCFADFELSRVDFCKNIEVENSIVDYLLCLKNFEFSRRNKQQFKAETLTFYNNTQELSFYNKVKEIKDKENKDIEIMDIVSDRKENILRVENRLKTAKAIKRELRNTNKVVELFDFKLCKENLLKNLNRLIKPDIQLNFSYDNSRQLIEQIKAERARDSFGEFLKVYGLAQFLACFDFDYELIRKFIIDVGYSRSQSYRIIDNLKDKYQRYCLKQEERDLLAELKSKIAV